MLVDKVMYTVLGKVLGKFAMFVTFNVAETAFWYNI